MPKSATRLEKDSLGTVRVPARALYGAQTQRAVENFPVSGIRFSRRLIQALGIIKGAAAQTNRRLGLLPAGHAAAIRAASAEVARGRWDGEFPLDIFQTGSGTSTNMNANEVIARLASRRRRRPVHPNDHVNMSQSSNDVIPTAIHVAAGLAVIEELLPAIKDLERTILKKAQQVDRVVKTGRTHLMDAMPVRMGQELSGWAAQLRRGRAGVEGALAGVRELALGGTAVGTGVNAPAAFGRQVAAEISRMTGVRFKASPNFFASLAGQEGAVALSGGLKTVAVAVMKIANDLRWMNSGPHAGLGEIALPALQPGSSIMPGKVNPVIPEAAAMAAAQVIGNDTTITLAGASGSFQLNVMLPVIAHNLLESIRILSSVSRLLADRAIAGFSVNRERIAELVERNPILVTALNPIIGYERGARIAKRAYRENRRVREVAAEETKLSPKRLKRALDPARMTRGGLIS
ncbi:MAG: aspartate ammonia-lyase [Candidatus Omnitrophica bacterium CG11_big_fil_rev_8_21_14_0_20_64_10]|nr:MAG: aspartate ammonia-lyase [Candidatus Omnitrophica bacterium CG11_big_fil_rev_8_21_14_0_20_64_10]